MIKSNIFIGLTGLTAFFGAASGSGLIKKEAPPTIASCENTAKQAEKIFRANYGYTLTDGQRQDYLHIDVLRRDCIEKARIGTRLTIAGL